MKTWPPPPDLESIRELVRVADPEGHLYEGAPADEYEPEEELIFAAISHMPTEDITAQNLLPIIQKIWLRSFASDGAADAAREPALRGLVEQIARFFGPGAQPQVRNQPST